MTEPQPFAVFGGVNVDRLATTDHPPIMGASNPGTTLRRVGGVGFNVAGILARLGHPVRLVARIGDDDDGIHVLAAAKALNIETEGISTSALMPTGTYTALFSDTGELIAGVADMRVYEELTPGPHSHIDDPLDRSEILVMDANLPAETLTRIAENARVGGHAIAALAVSPIKALRLKPCLAGLTWLFANRAEAVMLLEESGYDPPDDTADLARALAAMGPRQVIVSDGPHPLAIATAEAATTVAPPRVPVERVNGAGDSLAGGTLHGLAAGEDAATAVYAGLAAAGLTLEHGGIAEAAFEAGRLAHMTDLIRERDAV